MTDRRSVDFLQGLGPVAVVGDGFAAVTAATILRTLGATVATEPGLESRELRNLDRAAAVICDVVADGVEAAYLDEVARRPAGVWVTVSAFGLDGPRGGQAGSDLVCAAAGGLLSTVSDAADHFYPIPGQQALQVAGQMAVLALLHGISLTMDGADNVHLDVSVQEAIAFCSIQQEVAHLLYECHGPAGASRYATPSGVFECNDGEIGIIVLDDHQWRRACEVFGEPTWPQKYPTVIDRLTSRDVINAAVSDWTRARSKFVCETLLQAGGVAAVALRTLDDVRTLEQFRARDFVRGDSSEKLRTAVLPGLVAEGESRLCGDRRPLRALHVVEASNVLAGPLAGAILGAMGAEVVRLEDENRLDIYRRNGPFKHGEAGRERAAYFLMANYCKRSVHRGIGRDKQRADAIRRWADVLLENLGNRRLEQIGVGSPRTFADSGKASVSVSGFGRDGPCSEYKAYAPNVHAFGGLTKVVQQGANTDVTMQTSFADYCVAVWAATIAAAWWLGGRRGCAVDLSMAEVVAGKLNGIELSGPANTDRDVGREFLVRCADGSQIAVATQQMLSVDTVAATLGIGGDGLVVSPVAGVLVLDAAAVAGAAGGQDLLRAAEVAHVAMTAVPALTPEQVLGDRQLTHREFIIGLDHPEVDTSYIFALPWKHAHGPREGYRRAPLLAEDDEWMDAELLRSGDCLGTHSP